MNALNKLNRILEKVAEVGLVVFTAVIAVTIPFAVFSRYVLKNIPIWTDELSLFSLAWATMLGAAAGLKRGYQIGIRSLIEKSPPKLGRAIELAAYFFTIAFLSVMTYFGTVQTLVNMRQSSPAMHVPMAVPYMALPVGFALMLLFTLEETLEFLRGSSKRKGA